MSVPFSGGFTRSAGIYSAIGKQLKSVTLKPVKQILFKFDPFRPNVKTIRDCMFFFSCEKIVNTNPRCIIKTDIADNCEPTITITLDVGKNLLFKTENLDTFQVLQEFNKIVIPLVPKEEEILGKVAGKIAAGAGGKVAGKAAGKATGKPKPTRK